MCSGIRTRDTRTSLYSRIYRYYIFVKPRYRTVASTYRRAWPGSAGLDFVGKPPNTTDGFHEDQLESQSEIGKAKIYTPNTTSHYQCVATLRRRVLCNLESGAVPLRCPLRCPLYSLHPPLHVWFPIVAISQVFLRLVTWRRVQGSRRVPLDTWPVPPCHLVIVSQLAYSTGPTGYCY